MINNNPKGRPATGFSELSELILTLKKLKRKAMDGFGDWLKDEANLLQAETTINQISVADKTLKRDLNHWIATCPAPAGGS